MNTLIQKRMRRKAHIRKAISGTSAMPRLTVFKSNAHIYAQLIDDVNSYTLAAAGDLNVKSGTKVARAEEVGRTLASVALAKGITNVAFDRNGYRYHGRVKALADAARDAGLKF